MHPELIFPIDKTPYPRHPDSRPIAIVVPDGLYVYVLDEEDVIWILRDGPHRHSRILGGAKPVRYAGDMTVKDGAISDVTNLSGMFRCDQRDGLVHVASILKRTGLTVVEGAVRFFPQDGSMPHMLEFE